MDVFVRSLTVVQLKDLLGKLDGERRGNKAELTNRLLEW